MADPMTAGEASEHYLNSLEPEKAREERSAVDLFVEAMGGESRPMADIDGAEVEQYAATHAEALEHDADHAEPIRGFLAYASRLGPSRRRISSRTWASSRAAPAAGRARSRSWAARPST